MPAPADEITHIMPASAGRIKYCQLGMPALAGSVPLMISPSGETMDRYARVSGLHRALTMFSPSGEITGKMPALAGHINMPALAGSVPLI